MKRTIPNRFKRKPYLILLLLALACLSLPMPARPAGGRDDAKIIDMEFRDAQISDVVRIISESSGLNIVATNEAASRRVTLYLHDVSARQAMEIISKVGGLWYRHDREADVYRIMTTQEYQKDLVVFREEKTRIFRLLYPNPTSVATAIRDLYGDRVRYSEAAGGDYLGNMGGAAGGGAANRTGSGAANTFGGGTAGAFSRSPGGDSSTFSRSAGGRPSGGSGYGSGAQPRRLLDEELTVDQIDALERRKGDRIEVPGVELKGISRQEADIFIVVLPDQNTVAVRTSDLDAMDNIAGLIKEMDQPTSEVLLEMKVLDLTLGDSFHSLFDIKFVSGDGKSSFSLGNFIGGLNAPTLIYQFIDEHVKANIELLQKENRIDVLATPLLMASNNRPAQIFIGEERVLVTDVDTNTVTPATGAAVTNVDPVTEVRNVGNTLRILPKINADRTVTLAVQQDTSSVLPKSASIPISDGQGNVIDFPIDTVNTANLSATVVAKDGMSIAIGGMIRTTVSNDIQKVPLLGDIPYLGALFSKELRDRKKTEMVLLITPHIMMAPAEAGRVSDKVTHDLSRHPYFDNGDGAYEYYFDKFDPEGADDRPWAQPANPHPKHPRDRLRLPEKGGERPAGAAADVREPYAGLIRFAAMAVRQRIAPGEAPEGIRLKPLGAAPDKPLLSEIGVDATPLQSWRKDDLYVTSIQVKNRLRLPVTVDSTRLRGRWLAATLEKPALAGQGEAGDTTHLYVISAEPFHEALSR
jgi:type II secretory pathway component GspD/PulD (secretin)